MNRKPLIGICVGETENKIHDPKYKLLTIRVESYNRKPTDFIRFTLDKLNLNNNSVEGELLQKNENGLTWKNGVYPLPDVIYMQCRFDKKSIIPILENTSIPIFNSTFFDKIDNYNFFTRNEALKKLIPKTFLIKDYKDIENFFATNSKTILKPVKGFSGRGIVFIEKIEKDSYIAKYHLNKKSEEKIFTNIESLWRWIKESYHNDEYIIQEYITTIQKNSYPTDIRINFNRNEKGEWEVIRIFGRTALNGTHVGSKKGIHFTIFTLHSFLSKVFSEVEANEIVNKIIEIGKTICTAFENENEHMADLGVDFLLSHNKQLWLIEINTFPAPAGNDRSVTLPLEYAYYLATSKKNK